MRIVTMATGGIGGFLAVKLAKAGHEVACIARGAHLDAIRQNGLRLDGPDGSETVHPWKATDNADGLCPVDVVIMGVKAGALETAARVVLPVVSDQTLVVPFFNGVEAVERLTQILPERSVANGTAYVSTTLSAPGVIAQTGDFGRFVFGETDNSVSPRIQALQSALVAAGVQAEIPADITVEMWTKAVLMCAMSGTTAAARTTVGEIRDTPELAQLAQDVMGEAHDVAIAKGVALAPDLPQRYWEFVATLPDAMRASAAIDLERGNPLEIPWINGSIVRIGRKLGVPTPANKAILALLTPYAEGSR